MGWLQTTRPNRAISLLLQSRPLARASKKLMVTPKYQLPESQILSAK
jgi:hypothetical protein